MLGKLSELSPNELSTLYEACGLVKMSNRKSVMFFSVMAGLLFEYDPRSFMCWKLDPQNDDSKNS